jgi:hypothetical protein
LDLAQLKKDFKTLGLPVKLGDQVTDWDALMRVINAAPKLTQALEESREENDHLTRMSDGY